MHPEIRQDHSGNCPKCGMVLEAEPSLQSNAASQWTRPMHPEVVHNQPGNCPKCGMVLAPMGGAVENEDQTEYKDMKKRCIFAAIFTIPLVFIAMGDLRPSQPVSKMFSHEFIRWAELILGTPVVLWSGCPFFTRGWASIVNKSLNMFTLIGLGVGVAYVYSVIATLFPDLFPDSFRSMGKVAVYYEAAGVIVTLILLGQILELKARSQTNSAIKKLLGLSPKTARLIQDDGAEVDVPLDQVKIGDKLRVRPGEKVPVDGVVLEGSSSIETPTVRLSGTVVRGETEGENRAPSAGGSDSPRFLLTIA